MEAASVKIGMPFKKYNKLLIVVHNKNITQLLIEVTCYLVVASYKEQCIYARTLPVPEKL